MNFTLLRLLTDETCTTPEWRIVEVSQRLISHEINFANSITDLFDSKLLSGWFGALKKTPDARKCLSFIFKQKC